MKTFLSTACAVALMTSPRPPLPPTHGRMKAARGSGKGVMGRRVRATRRGGIVRGIKSPRVTPPPSSAKSRVEASLRATSRRFSDAEYIVGRLRPHHRERTIKISPCAALYAAALIRHGESSKSNAPFSLQSCGDGASFGGRARRGRKRARDQAGALAFRHSWPCVVRSH